VSLFGDTTDEVSNSLTGEEVDITGEERRSDGALFSDAPKEIQVEHLDIISEEPLLFTSWRRLVNGEFSS
jgi:hypothetical protein